MKKRISTLQFEGTERQARQLGNIIEGCKKDKSMLMYVMQQAQLIYGYLPYEVQVMIAEGMDVPLEKVYGISTFYSQFTLSPKGKNNISVCLGTACYVKGSKQVLDKVCEVLGINPGECTSDRLFSIEECRCIGACGLAPVIMINDEVYGNLAPGDVEGIIDIYRNKN